VTGWIALSDTAPQSRALQGERLPQGLFVLEFAVPVRGSAVLLQHRSAAGDSLWSVFLDPEAGMMILHRQGAGLRRYVLPGPVPTTVGVARLGFRFDVAWRDWHMQLDILGHDAPMTAAGSDPLPLALDDLAALCAGRGQTQRHPAVLWFGATTGDALPDRAPWIGLGTRVDTLKGPVPANALRPGDQILTLDDGPVPVLRVTRRALPSAGFFAPVLLRAPFFGAQRDLLTSSDQLVMLSGTQVEYHFGEDEVLVPAAALIDGRRALAEHRRAVTISVALDLGCPALFTADGCVLMSDGADRLTPPPRRVLLPFEVKPLIGHSARLLKLGAQQAG